MERVPASVKEVDNPLEPALTTGDLERGARNQCEAAESGEECGEQLLILCIVGNVEERGIAGEPPRSPSRLPAPRCPSTRSSCSGVRRPRARPCHPPGGDVSGCVRGPFVTSDSRRSPETPLHDVVHQRGDLSSALLREPNFSGRLFYGRHGARDQGLAGHGAKVRGDAPSVNSGKAVQPQFRASSMQRISKRWNRIHAPDAARWLAIGG